MSHRVDARRVVRDAAALDWPLLRAWPLPVETGIDKYSRGTVLVVGGSTTTPGAAVLAGRAALRMGAGRVQIATVAEVAIAIGVAFPEAMVMPWEPEPDTSLRESIAQADAVVVGPGMVGDEVVDVVHTVLEGVGQLGVVVLDAAAIMLFPALQHAALDRVHDRLVMTPNRQETQALIPEPTAGDADVLAVAASATGAVLASFGGVAAPDGRRWQSDVDVVGLGTAGSGDVLAGLVGGAAARCGDPSQAACWATLAHLEAARRLDARLGTLGYTASDLVDEVPACLQID